MQTKTEKNRKKWPLRAMTLAVAMVLVLGLGYSVFAEGGGSQSGASGPAATTEATADATTSLPEDPGEEGESASEEPQASAPEGPAMAPQEVDGAGITTYWEANNTDSISIEANTSQTFFVGVSNGESESGAYELKITVKNDDGLAPDTGFAIGAYASVEALNGAAKSVALSANGTVLTYVLDDNFSYVGIQVTLNAVAGKPYPGEQAAVTVALYKNGGETALYTGTTLTATAAYKQLDWSGYCSYKLISPTFLPVGAHSGANAISASLWLNGATTSGDGAMRMSGTLKLDFSPVNITVGAVTKTYAEWLADPSPYQASPVTFLQNNGSALDTGNTLTHTFVNTSAYFDAYFKIETTADFDFVNGVAPKIEMKALPTFIVRINNRGPNITAATYTGAAPADAQITIKQLSVVITAQEAKPTVTIDRSTGSASVPYIHPNSVSFWGDSVYGFRYYQELFRVTASAALSSGEDTTIQFNVPASVAIKYIRLPKISDAAKYTSVEYNGVTYNPGDVIDTGVLAAGGSVTLKINGLIAILLRSGYGIASSGCGIQFAGTTSGLTEGDDVTFEAVLPDLDFNTVVSSVTTKVSTQYQIDPAVVNLASMFKGENLGAFGGAAEKGSSFYTYTQFSQGGYFYTGGLVANPAVAGYPTVVFPDPVVYFSVPAGLDVGEVVLSADTDYYGKTIAATITKIFENAGEFAAASGKLVEVKLHEAGDVAGHVWIISTTTVNLKLTVPAYYNGAGSITFPVTSVLLGTWNSGGGIKALGTSSSYGGTAAIANPPASGMLNTVPKLAYSGSIKATSVPITAPQTVSVNVGVRNGSDYLSYNPTDPDTTPEMMAGSDNGQYRVYVHNGLNETVNNGVAYFMVPRHASWATAVNGAPSLTLGGGADAAKVYVTTGALTAAGGNTTSSLEGKTWCAVTFTDGAANLPGGVSAWGAVTGFKYEFSTLPKGGYLDMLIPFGVPPVSGSVQYGQVAIGQTLYYFNSSITSQNATTAAVKLVKSEVPVVRGLGAANAEADVNGGTTYVEYKTALPNWAGVAVYDDFTAGLRLARVMVAYTPSAGSTTAAYNKEFTVFSDTSYTTTQSGTYVEGSISTISDTQNAVSNSVLGAYVITYTTTKDADDQETVMTRTIVVRKTAGSVSMLGSNIELFTTDSVPAGHTTWQEYFRTLLEVTDSDGFDLATQGARLTATSDGGFNAGVPGSYTLAYTYTDIAGNTATANIVATVKLVGSVGGSAATTGSVPVPGVTVTLTGGGAMSTDASGGYSFDLQASAASPAAANYGLTFSDIPAGLKIPASLTAGGSITTAAPNAAANLELTPITIAASLGNGAANWADAVALYTGGGTLVESKPVQEGTGSYTFASATWFSGDYYLQITLKNGYQAGTGGDFTQNGAGSLKTASFTVAHDDVAKTAAVLPMTYTVSFDGNGGAGSITPISVVYLEDASLPTNGFSRTGYDFVGWAGSAGGEVITSYTQTQTNAVTLYAKWSYINYTLTYNKNDAGGSSATATGGTLHYGDSITPSAISSVGTAGANWSRAGYSFDGWYTDSGLTGKVDENTTMPAAATTLYAKWSLIDYTLTYNKNDAGGSSVTATGGTLHYGGSITLSGIDSVGTVNADWSRTGYDFEGWYTDAACTQQWVTTGTVSGDVTLYAKWKQVVFTVRFEDGDGSLVREEKVNLGGTATPPAPPERYGHIFKGWSGNYTNVTKDELVVAVYERNTDILPETVTVTFNYNDGRGTYTTVTVSFGDGQNNGLGGSMPANPTGSGAFSGWNRTPDGNGAGFAANTYVTSNITVYAQWGSGSEYYTLSFNLNGVAGTPPASQSLRAGSLATAVASPASDSYTFEGWNTAADGSGSGWNFGGTAMPARNVTLYAQWSDGDSSALPATSTATGGDGTGEGAGTAGGGTGQGGQGGQNASAGTINIGGAEIPLFGSAGHWGLINLILSGAGVLLALAALITYFTGRDEHKKRLVTRIVAIAIAVASVVVITATQNFGDAMALADNWTALILAFLVSEVVFVLLSRGQKISGDSDDDDEELYGKASHSYTTD